MVDLVTVKMNKHIPPIYGMSCLPVLCASMTCEMCLHPILLLSMLIGQAARHLIKIVPCSLNVGFNTHLLGSTHQSSIATFSMCQSGFDYMVCGWLFVCPMVLLDTSMCGEKVHVEPSYTSHDMIYLSKMRPLNMFKSIVNHKIRPGLMNCSSSLHVHLPFCQESTHQ